VTETLTCPTCGAVIGVPETGIPKGGIECVWCGTKCSKQAIDKPPPPRTQEPEPTPKPQKERERERKAEPVLAEVPPTSKPERAKSKFVREQYDASDDPEDMLPYLVEAKEVTTEKCPSCDLDKPYNSVVCPHCGFDTRTRKRVQREFVPISKTWILGWPMRVRMPIFIICLFINLMTFGVGYFVSKQPPATLVGAMIVIVIQAFLLGTFSTLSVKRNSRGASQVQLSWRFCFLPAIDRVIKTNSFAGVLAGSYSSIGLSEILVFIILLFGAAAPMFGILFDGPTVLLVIELLVPLISAGFWWYYAMWSVRYYSALTTQNNYPDTYLYRGLSQEKAQDITRTINEATTLPIVGGA